MESVTDLIESIEHRIDLCWGNLVTSQIEDGMKIIDELFGDIDFVINDISKDSSIDIGAIYNIFGQLEKAMKVPDYILIGDILKYEVNPLLSTWKAQMG